jgi:GTP-binding protein
MSEHWKFLDEVHDYKRLPLDNIPEVIFWGRSNVGKSSLINSITKSKIAKTSKTPGRTRSLIFFQLENKLRLVDFPGYGFSKIPKNNEYKLDILIDEYLKKRKSIIKLFLLIDSKHGFKETDKLIINQLDRYLHEKVFLVFTKTDRLKKLDEKSLLENHNRIANDKFNKNFFNTSIKEINTIILLKKFLMGSLEK